MKPFHIDEPREIGKKRKRIPSGELRKERHPVAARKGRPSHHPGAALCSVQGPSPGGGGAQGRGVAISFWSCSGRYSSTRGRNYRRVRRQCTSNAGGYPPRPMVRNKTRSPTPPRNPHPLRSPTTAPCSHSPLVHNLSTRRAFSPKIKRLSSSLISAVIILPI